MATIAARSLNSPVASLSKVKPADARRLSKLGIETIRDLLMTLPFDWEIYGAPRRIADLGDGESATVVGNISSSVAQVTYRKRVRLTQATLTDDHGDVMRVVWFNQPYLANRLPAGARVAVAGHVKSGPRGLEMRNPHYEPLQSDGDAGPSRIGGLMAKYHLVAGVTSKRMAEFVAEALPLASELEEVLPAETRLRMGLVGVVDAVRLGHQPRTEADWQVARKRMAFAELFELQTAFALMRANLALEPAIPIPYRQEVIDAFKAGLGFELTNAQRRSTWEAFQDMQRPSPMNRLLNGDVGSGKTAVAAACVAMAHAAGLPSVVMAPTEALALYGEMAVSVIDELPPGRTPVMTEVISKHNRSRAYDLVREQVRLGRQAFVICPLIEESEVLAVRSATAELERLRKDVFQDL